MKLEKFINEGINDAGIFKTAFMAGHPGSGKSYTLNRIKSGQVEPRVVNTDKFIEHFDNDISFLDRAKTLTKNQLVLYINSMLPLAVDGTSANPSSVLKRYGLLESFGYDMAMVFVETSLETAIERVRQRNRKVPEKVIIEFYNEVSRMKSFYKTKFPVFVTVKNDEGELNNDMILKSFKKLSSFYNSDVKNTIGKHYIETMRENGWKYLSPHLHSVDEIKRTVSIWYRS
jgi:predicted kinase